MMNGSNGMTNGGFWLMLLVGLFLVALLGLAIYLALRVKPAPPSGGPVESAAPSPRDILDLRLARGDISPEDYSTARPLLDS